MSTAIHEIQFPVGSFVYEPRRVIGEVNHHDIYEVLTNPFVDTYMTGDRGPFILGRRCSETVYPDRVDRLLLNGLAPIVPPCPTCGREWEAATDTKENPDA